MEDVRNYQSEDQDDEWHVPDDEREYSTAPPEDEVPFHIPRD